MKLMMRMRCAVASDERSERDCGRSAYAARHQVEDGGVDARSRRHVHLLLVLEPEIAQEARQQGANPALRHHGNGHQAFRAGDVAAQDGVGNSQHQHAIGPAEGDFVVAGRVAQGEVTGAEARFASVLAIDAFAFHLQVQEEQRRACAGHVCA